VAAKTLLVSALEAMKEPSSLFAIHAAKIEFVQASVMLTRCRTTVPLNSCDIEGRILEDLKARHPKVLNAYNELLKAIGALKVSRIILNGATPNIQVFFCADRNLWNRRDRQYIPMLIWFVTRRRIGKIVWAKT